MRSFLITSAALSVLASTALSKSTPSSFSEWIEDSFPSCATDCYQNYFEDLFGDDCGDDAFSSTDSDTIACLCRKGQDLTSSSSTSDAVEDMGRCLVQSCDSPSDVGSADPRDAISSLTSLCRDALSGDSDSDDDDSSSSSSNNSSDDDDEDDDEDAAPLTKANMISAAGAVLLAGAYLL